ncbi:MAG: pantetheine-phosphate adenylyltransferase [Oscillospiraceae bacterium]|nr:pantetheine-phosphate adenylyltransferase [Oscillospiraceae bacterium]
MDKQNICVIPGVFDPVTNGHLDVILRAAKIFDKIYVTSFDNSSKKTMFNPEERLEMLRLACGGIEKVIIDATSDLLVEYAKSKTAGFIIKGIRNIIDYEYESDMFRINREIGGIDTLFFPAKTEHLYISSTFVREMIMYKRDISGYVPEKVNDYIAGILKKKAKNI